MAVLSTEQRSALEKAVIKARRVSEEGAANALRALAVHEPEAYAHMKEVQRELRRHLRAKGRMLGDVRADTSEQGMRHLATELAYEYWHRMLFATFLEANNLLMHPKAGVSVSFEELEELAVEEGHANKWAAAAAYASAMLPAIFRSADPLMRVEYSPNDRSALEDVLAKIETAVFSADDALGWVYQFWQTEAKKAINDSGEKIDGERLPAVTQLFTEPYMVHFLIDNTLGAWWVGRHPGVKPPVKFEYLRVLEDGTPAAGKFEGWPNRTAEVTALDPCMGSGHFVASLFPVFAALRMQEEGLTKEEATDRVIAENLYGLELDPRCTQIAAFNLALTAWKFCGHYKGLPEMNLACSGVAPKGKLENWVSLVGKVDRFEDKARLENGMKVLYEHFQLAPELGSLIDPTTIKADTFTASFAELEPVLKKALENEADTVLMERGVMAAGIAKAGQLLSKKYTLQITNVPYLARGKQGDILANYCLKNFPSAKGNLATVFLLKMLKSAEESGIVANVTLQDWLFQTTNKKLRQNLLKDENWSIVCRLGAKGFQTPMYDFNVMLISIQHLKPNRGTFFTGLDVSEAPNATAKQEALRIAVLKSVNQKEQLENSDSRIVMEERTSNQKMLIDLVDSYEGMGTGDLSRFQIFCWENIIDGKMFVPLRTTSQANSYFSGCINAVLWANGSGEMIKKAREQNSRPTRGFRAWGKSGITINRMQDLSVSIFLGEKFDCNVAAIIPKQKKNLPAIFCFCSTPEYKKLVRNIDQSLKVTNHTLVKVPFDLEYWQKVAAEKYPNGLPKPYSDDPTQWLFHGHPIKTEKPLQVALARVLGYRWPAENDTEMELAEEARTYIEAVKAFDHLSDEDGIVCLSPLNGEAGAAERLRAYLQAVFGDRWDNHTVTGLLQQEGAAAKDLDRWLRDEFFIQHCKLFQNRPFIWQIWDGHKDGFSALVNYHLLTRENLNRLIYTYLGDWIHRCEMRQKAGESGADGQLIAARALKEKLELIVAGEPPLDVFVRWKKPEEQPIGWNPDLNDGVRMNIYPFMQAGVLRKNPNIKWDKDRGKNPSGSVWGPDRYNRYEHLGDAYKLKDTSGKVIPSLTNAVKEELRKKSIKS